MLCFQGKIYLESIIYNLLPKEPVNLKFPIVTTVTALTNTP